MSEFDDDYFRQLLEKMEVVEGERKNQEVDPRRRDTVEHVDRAVARRMRPEPQLLQLTLDRDVLAGDGLRERLDDLYELRTTLCRRLEASDVSESSVLLLMRSILAGIQDQIAHFREPDFPADILADLLRQERTAHLLGRDEIVEAWRVLFELQAERGNWALAEDYLFHAVELAGAPDTLVHRGVDFFQELHDLPEHELEAAGLTRDEVDRARWDLLELAEEE